MNFLRSFHKKNLKRDLVNKFFYKKTNNVPKIKKIILNFNCKTTKLSNLASSLLALEIITSKCGSLTITKKANMFLKIKEGNPVGCKIILRHTEMFKFLESNVVNVLPRLRYFSTLFVKPKSHKNTFFYSITDLFIFTALEKNYYVFNELNKLNITIVTNSKTKKETIFFKNAFSYNYD